MDETLSPAAALPQPPPSEFSHQRVPKEYWRLLPRWSSLNGVNRWDWLFALTFLAFAGVYFLGCLQQNYPMVILSGDGSNIASYAASLDHPDWFKADPVLGSIYTIGVYATIHLPLIRALARLNGDYGLASIWLVFPETFLQLLGFYILGKVIFKNRFWAFLLALMTAMTVYKKIGMGEIWGVWWNALPRVTFQSLLPFLLALVFIWKDHPGRWPWLMVFSGLLVYVHPISAPTWGFAIWLSLWLLLPKDWGRRRRILVMLGLGGLFLVAITPFTINYLSHQVRDKVVDYQTVMTILQTYSPLNIPAALIFFLKNMTLNLLLPVALAGFVATWLLRRSDRLPVKVVLVWMAGLFITCLLLPFIEQIVTQQLHILPLETELVRGIRYFVPLLLLFWLWPLAEATPRLVKPQACLAVLASGILLLCFWGVTNRTDLGYIHKTLSCFLKVQVVCPSSHPIDGLIDALRNQTSPGEGIFFFNQNGNDISQSLSVRYAALRPLVYSGLDSGMLNYSNRSSLPAWLKITQMVEALRSMTDPVERLKGLISLAKSLKAKYLVIDFMVAPEALSNLPVTITMQNNSYILLQLR
jgi:hypothetical protein